MDFMSIFRAAGSKKANISFKPLKKVEKGDDIVHVHDITLQCSKPYHEFDGYVDFSFGIFQILDANGMDHFQWPDYELEVIGNIHDNPELLKGGGEA